MQRGNGDATVVARKHLFNLGQCLVAAKEMCRQSGRDVRLSKPLQSGRFGFPLLCDHGTDKPIASARYRLYPRRAASIRQNSAERSDLHRQIILFDRYPGPRSVYQIILQHGGARALQEHSQQSNRTTPKGDRLVVAKKHFAVRVEPEWAKSKDRRHSRTLAGFRNIFELFSNRFTTFDPHRAKLSTDATGDKL